MKRVLLIHNIFWSHYKAIVFSELAAQIKNRYELKVLQIALTERSRQNLGTIDYNIHRYSYEILFNSTYQETSVIQRFLKISQQINQFKPDIVVLPGYDDPAYLAIMVLVKSKGIILMTTADSTAVDHQRVWYKETFKKLMLKLPNGLLCYGSRAREYLRQLGVDEDKIFVRIQATDNDFYRKQFLTNSIAVKEKAGDSVPYNFIYVGRMLKSKRVDMLIHAFARCRDLEDRTAGWRVQLIGTGEEIENLQALAKDLEVDDRIDFIGPVSWDELPAWYGRATVFVFPSASETWGLVINEAMLCELPILASNHCGATPDLVVDGVNGYSFDPFNTEQLSELMLKFIRKEVDAGGMGSESLRIVSEFSPKRAAAQMLAAFDVMAHTHGNNDKPRHLN